MNLMKLFNKNYLIQNLKKSRTVLAIFIGLIPILNTIILTMFITSNENYILGFANISILNLIGIYFLPVIVSICLFNYIYKKKSVDFINSMPISRKSIFVTNTILGVIIFSLMLLINTLLTLIISLIFNSPIPFMMLFDYFWFFLLVYIFTFSATNLAMTISGNAITQIVVTLLLLFLVPYTNVYLTELYHEEGTTTLLECTTNECLPEKYYCYDDEECLANEKENKYNIHLSPIVDSTFTTPFKNFVSLYNSENTFINPISIIKMLILSIIYIILGFISFQKRKMEICETSFKNPHIHNLVKSLTLIPIATLAYAALRYANLFFIIFVVIIMLIYYFIYDLITKKQITNIKLSSIYFLITIILITTICSLIDKEVSRSTILNYAAIKEVAVELRHDAGLSTKEKIYTNNKELISLITKSLLNDYENTDTYFNIYLKTTNNQEYQTGISINKETYNKLLSLLETESEYINTYKDINIDEVYALKLGNQLYTKDDAKNYLELIKSTLNDLTLQEFLELQEKYRYQNDEYNITLYTYEDHDRQSFTISAYIDYDLLNTIVNINNKHLEDNLSLVIPSDYYIYYENTYLEQYYNIDFYVIRSAKNELYNFILQNIEDEVDMRKEYITFSVQLNSNTYYFTTNNVEEIKSILTKKYEELKDTKDYKSYYGVYTKEEEVAYYD